MKDESVTVVATEFVKMQSKKLAPQPRQAASATSKTGHTTSYDRHFDLASKQLNFQLLQRHTEAPSISIW